MRIRHFTIAKQDRVARAFFANRAFFSGIMGPVGGGKTVLSLQRFIRFAKLQAPHPVDNIRRTRWVSIRRTYRELERTTLRTWNEWWPREAGEWRGGANGEPATHKIEFDLSDGTTVQTEVIFAATGDQDIQEFAGGFEVTGFHLGEAADHEDVVASKMLERVGRYPRVEKDVGFAGATWLGGWADFNAPNYGHWIERDFVSNPRPDYEFFRQPGGLDADAENLQNLRGGREYYVVQARNKPEHEVRRMIHNMFGFDRSGKPVYAEYNPFKHLSKMPLKLLRGRKLFCGIDQGQSPAAVFVQRSVEGQLRILREISVFNTGPSEFGRMLRQMIDEDFPDWDITFIVDPAAFNATDTSENANDVWQMIVSNVLNETLRPAPSNRRTAREQPFRSHMLKSLSSDVEAMIVDPSCKMVHEGLLHKFRYRKVSASGQAEKFAKDIEDNDWTHVVEAAEYASMGAVGLNETLGLSQKYSSVAQQNVEADNWRPAGF